MAEGRVEGVCPPAFAGVREVFERSFEAGEETGARFTFAVEGEVFVDLWGGFADKARSRDFDELTLARWLAQTLGQLEGRAWRLSHPLIGAYRLVAQLAHERQTWLKRLATPPLAYAEAACCRAPFLPLTKRRRKPNNCSPKPDTSPSGCLTTTRP